MSLQSPSIQIISRKYYLLKKEEKEENKSLLTRKPEKAGQTKIRTFPLSRKSKKGWPAKLEKIERKKIPLIRKPVKGYSGKN